MAKGSGKTRSGGNFTWSHDDSYEGVVHDAQNIFKREATLGLGDFTKRKPTFVSEDKYEKLLKSGDYIEMYHGGTKDSLIGKYYINNELHTSGFGYYFTKNESTAQSYADKAKGEAAAVLIKKSDILSKSELSKVDRVKLAESYIGKNAVYQNGKTVSDDRKYDYYQTSTAAARKGYRAVQSIGTNVVVIDRSAIVMKKKG